MEDLQQNKGSRLVEEVVFTGFLQSFKGASLRGPFSAACQSIKSRSAPPRTKKKNWFFELLSEKSANSQFQKIRIPNSVSIYSAEMTRSPDEKRPQARRESVERQQPSLAGPLGKQDPSP